MSEVLRSAVRSEDADQVLADLIAEITDQLHAGRRVDVEAYIARCPERAEQLRRLLPALELLDGLKSQSSRGDAAGPENEASADGMVAGVLGDFRIIREVGKGGMGVVYEADQVSLRRRVALKVLPFAATMDPRHLQRFRNEAQAAACLHHTNIVPVFSVGCERGVHFYAMQFIDGQPLSELIRQMQHVKKKPPAAGEDGTVAYQPSGVEAASTPSPAAELTPRTGEGRRSRDYFRKVAELGIQAAEALDHAHQLGIVHRDVKPGNLMLDGRGNLWVTDFGLAHMQHGEASLTLTGQAVGTPRYMSPEQALAKRVPTDHRTDVYSLGATLYELLTLHPAFTSEDRHELLRQIAFEDPPRPRRLGRGIPAELEIIVLKAMEKRPQDRYATAQDMANDLRHWLEDRPIRARRPTWIQVMRKCARRHRALVGSAVAVLALAGLFLVGSIGWIVGDRSARRSAIERVVRQALDESLEWQNLHQWSKARAAARRAVMLSVGGEVNADLRRRVSERDNDLELIEALERLPLSMANFGGSVDFGAFHVAFQLWGLDLDREPSEQVLARIRTSTVLNEFIRALDIGAVARLYVQGVKDPKGHRFLRILRAIDSDGERNRFRDALRQGGGKILLDLTKPEVARRLIPASQYYLLAFFLLNADEPPSQVPALLELQRRHPDDLDLNLSLGHAFANAQPPRYDEALRFFTAASALRPEQNSHHIDIGWILEKKGDSDGAIAEYREALRSGAKNDLSPVKKLCDLFIRLNDIDAAITVYRKFYEANSFVIRGTHESLLPSLRGHALKRKGLFIEAPEQHPRSIGHEYVRWMDQMDRLVVLDSKLSHVLEGKAQPANADERLELALMCLVYRKLNVAASRLFHEAFSEQPQLADNPREQDRYSAACAAALAGCGQGKDADKLDAKERARLRQQALDWLRFDLEVCRRLMEKDSDEAAPMIAQRMQHWLKDEDFAGVRGDKALAKLPEAERRDWRKLWEEAEALRRAAQPPKTASPARP